MKFQNNCQIMGVREVQGRNGALFFLELGGMGWGLDFFLPESFVERCRDAIGSEAKISFCLGKGQNGFSVRIENINF